MRRGDLVTVALQGDYGKPRPALVIQADQFADGLACDLVGIDARFHVGFLSGGSADKTRGGSLL